MTDETPKTTEQRAPNATTQTGTTSSSGTQQNKPATGGRIEHGDKPSDASKTQDTGGSQTRTNRDTDSSGTDKSRSMDTAQGSNDSRSEKDRSQNRKPIDQQGKPSPLTPINPKAPQAEGQARSQQDKKPAGQDA